VCKKCNKKYNENANELTINMDHGKVLMAFSCLMRAVRVYSLLVISEEGKCNKVINVQPGTL
jgi:hypothetical protein